MSDFPAQHAFSFAFNVLLCLSPNRATKILIENQMFILYFLFPDNLFVWAFQQQGLHWLATLHDKQFNGILADEKLGGKFSCAEKQLGGVSSSNRCCFVLNLFILKPIRSKQVGIVFAGIKATKIKTMLYKLLQTGFMLRQEQPRATLFSSLFLQSRIFECLFPGYF